MTEAKDFGTLERTSGPARDAGIPNARKTNQQETTSFIINLAGTIDLND
jgi:hypothetical protein